MVIIAIMVKDSGSHLLDKISELESRSNLKLSVGAKLLLAETGTLEQTLSILCNSEIQVSVTKQKEEGNLIHRDVCILRKKTGETLVTAKSRFFVANLPRAMVDQLRKRNLGIGSIITRNQIETFRKIVKIGYNSNSNSVFRIYKIIHHGKVAIEIKEYFSVDIDSKLGLPFQPFAKRHYNFLATR